MIELTGSHLIDGRWKRSEPTFAMSNPATGAGFAERFCIAGPPEVDAALSAAQRTFQQSHALPHGWPAALLDAIAAAIMDLGDALLDRAEAETALSSARLTGERARTVNQLRMFAEIVREGSWIDATIDTAQPDRKPLPRADIRRMFRPRGPAVVFGASNFPFAFGVCGGDTASALAARNPVVCKGHPSHPGTNELFARAVLSALEKCALPHGLFSLLQGKSHDLGGLLAKHPATTAIGFTGSHAGGRALCDIAAARPRPIPVYAEMGSLNPLIICPGALAEKANAIAQGLAGSVLLGLGQFCTKPGLIFTIGDADSFVAALTKQMSASSGGAMLNARLRDGFCERATEFANVPGVKTLVTAAPSQQAMMSPALFDTCSETWRSRKALHEEAFGPGTLIIRCRDAADVLECLKQLEGSLTGTIHVCASESPRIVQPLLRALESLAGRVIVNGYPTGVEVCNAIVHGGPYPATTDPGWTSVGSAAIRRWVRLVAYQDVPDALLPPELQDANPLAIERVIDGKRTRSAIA